MPKITQKQQIIEKLEAKASVSAAAENENNDFKGQETLELMTLLRAVDACRYLEERIHLSKSNMMDHCMYIQGLEDNRFRQEVRMDYNSFKALLGLIQPNKQFESNGSHPQSDIRIQMIVALERLGTYGNGTSVGRVARKAGISGSVVKFTQRFIVAVIQELGEAFLNWPTTAEKSMIKKRIQEQHEFPSCIGFVDGTLLRLSARPSWDPVSFYCRKSFYAIAAMLVCDDKKRIRMCYSGHAGSAHDNRVYNDSNLRRNSAQYFQDDEYILGDSAYSASLNVVPILKNRNTGFTAEEQKFNWKHARARVKVEHCVGILKGQFQSLREIRTPVANKLDVARINIWLKTCCILHNFFIVMQKAGLIGN